MNDKGSIFVFFGSAVMLFVTPTAMFSVYYLAYASILDTLITE